MGPDSRKALKPNTYIALAVLWVLHCYCPLIEACPLPLPSRGLLTPLKPQILSPVKLYRVITLGLMPRPLKPKL